MSLIVKHVVCFITCSIQVTYPMHLPFRKREELLQKSKECEREGKQEQAWKLKGQAIEVTYDHVVAFVKVKEDVKIIRFFSCVVL